MAEDPDLAITIDRTDLEAVMMGAKTSEEQIADGTAKLEGDASVLQQLPSTMVEFDPRFEIMPGTKSEAQAATGLNAYATGPVKPAAE